MPAERLSRGLDVIGAFLGLTLLSPVMLGLAAAIKLDSRGPVFYRARRVGKGGIPFRLYKFRSMVADADKHGPGITSAGDMRVTRIGRFLRASKLDELPQLLNVLRGEMSLVGPRPEDPRYVALYTEAQREVLQARPGITSAASLKFRREETMLQGDDWEKLYREQVLPAKLAIDLDYLRHRSLRSDICLILQTILAVFR